MVLIAFRINKTHEKTFTIVLYCHNTTHKVFDVAKTINVLNYECMYVRTYQRTTVCLTLC